MQQNLQRWIWNMLLAAISVTIQYLKNRMFSLYHSTAVVRQLKSRSSICWHYITSACLHILHERVCFWFTEQIRIRCGTRSETAKQVSCHYLKHVVEVNFWNENCSKKQTSTGLFGLRQDLASFHSLLDDNGARYDVYWHGMLMPSSTTHIKHQCAEDISYNI